MSEVRFCDVSEEMALKEGENESLAGWRADHEAYFRRNGGYTLEMPLIFEVFELVEILSDLAEEFWAAQRRETLVKTLSARRCDVLFPLE